MLSYLPHEVSVALQGPALDVFFAHYGRLSD